jgi:hypothetical protein
MGNCDSNEAVSRRRVLGKVSGLLLLSECLGFGAHRLFGRPKLAGARFVVAFVLGPRYAVRRSCETGARAVRRRSS